MDQHIHFRRAVCDVLTILLDESRSPSERVTRAADILLGLPVPVLPADERWQDAEPADTLYCADANGLPSATVYVPDDLD